MDVLHKAVDLLTEHMEESSHKNTSARLRRGNRILDSDRHVAREVLKYLQIFGYFERLISGWQDITLGDIVEAIKRFQIFFEMRSTGDIDYRTWRLMQDRRCGFPDIIRDYHTGVQRMIALADQALPRWKKDGVHYLIKDYLPALAKADQDRIVAKAFADWCQYAEIAASVATNVTPDIVIGTGRGSADNFDGPQGTLAWAYLPDGSDQQLTMKYDLDETWITDPAKQGILVANVSCHEFGHLLGLSHSRIQTALMAPYYAVGVVVPQQQDDIPRLQARYGAKMTPSPTPPTPVDPPVTPPSTTSTMTVTAQSFSSITIDGKKIL